jgi:hypothetical protein
MARIEVKQKETDTFEVTVRDTTTTTHLARIFHE